MEPTVSFRTREELDKEAREDAHRQRQELMDGESASAGRLRLQNEAEQLTLAGRVGVALNTENMIYRGGQRLGVELATAMQPDDPNFDAKATFEKYHNEIHPSLWKRALDSNSDLEFNTIMELSRDQEKQRALASNMGASGILPSVLSAIVDADAMFLFLSGGSYLGPKMAAASVAATGARSSRVASMAYGAGAAVEGAMVTEVGNRLLDMGYEHQDLPTVLATSLTFGTGLGALTRMERNASARVQEALATQKLRKQGMMPLERALDIEATQRADIISGGKVDAEATPKVRQEETEFRPEIDQSQSTGAAKVRATYGRQYNDTTKAISEDSELKLEQMGYHYTSSNTFEPRTRAEKVADAIENGLNHLPWLRTDMDTMMMSNSPTAMLLGLQMFESASGKYRGINRTAAVEKQAWETRLTRNVAIAGDSFRGWAKENKLKLNKKTEADFNRQVRMEMYNRYYDGAKGDNAYINQFADAMDKDFSEALSLMKERGVHGAEDVDWRTGWMPQRWSSSRYFDMIDSGIAHEQIEQGLVNAYRRQHPTWTEDYLRVTAKAVLSRAKNMAEGMDTNIYRILQQDGRAALGELFKRNGMSANNFEKFADLLEADLLNRGKSKILKSRNEIDPRTPIPGTEFTVMDLMDDNLIRTNSMYARTASGVSALAGIGIRSRADFEKLKDAIKNEIVVNQGKLTGMQKGVANSEDDEFLNNIYTAFAGGATNRRVAGMARRAIQISNLSLLNQMGFTQAAETATIIAANGYEAFVEAAAGVINLKDPKVLKALANDLEQMGVPIAGEHNLIRTDLFLDDITQSNRDLRRAMSKDKELADVVSRYFQEGGGFDDMLGKGQRLQGYLSGFYAVRHAQHVMQDRSFLQAIGKHINGSKKFSAARLKDMGFTPEIMDALKKDWANVTYDGKIITGLNIDKWSKKSVDELRAIMTRVRNQNVQATLIGEGMHWQTKTLGAVMANLRTFTLLGLKKQTMRHARIADARSVAAVLMGVPFAGMVYAARQAVNGNDRNLSPEAIMRGAFNYAGVTAPVPMLADPMFALMGMDDFQMGNFGARDFSGEGYKFIPDIPSFDTLNRLGHLPASVWNIATGDYNAGDITAIQAVPIIGNMVGMNAIFNHWKGETRTAKARAKAEAKKPQMMDFKGHQIDRNDPDAIQRLEDTGKVKWNNEKAEYENVNELNALDGL